MAGGACCIAGGIASCDGVGHSDPASSVSCVLLVITIVSIPLGALLEALAIWAWSNGG